MPGGMSWLVNSGGGQADDMLRVKDPVGTVGEYYDREKIHGGGSSTTALGTFLAFFLPRFCTFFW